MNRTVSLGSILAIVTTLLAAGGIVSSVTHYLDSMSAAIAQLQHEVQQIEADLHGQAKSLTER